MISRCIMGRAIIIATVVLTLTPAPMLIKVTLAVIASYATASLPLAVSLGVVIMNASGGITNVPGLGGLPLDYGLIGLPVMAAVASMARHPPRFSYRLEGFALPAAALGALLGGYNSCIDLARPILAVLAAKGLPGILQMASFLGGFSWQGLAILSLAAITMPLRVKVPIPTKRMIAGIPGRWPAAMLGEGPPLGGNGLACAVIEPIPTRKMLIVVDSHEPWRTVKCLGLRPDVVICPSCQWMEWEKLTGLPVRSEETGGKGIILFEGAFPADIALAGPPPSGTIVAVDLTGSPPPAGGWRHVLSYALKSDAPVMIIAQSGAPKEIPSVGGRIPVRVRSEPSLEGMSEHEWSFIIIEYNKLRLFVPCG